MSFFNTGQLVYFFQLLSTHSLTKSLFFNFDSLSPITSSSLWLSCFVLFPSSWGRLTAPEVLHVQLKWFFFLQVIKTLPNAGQFVTPLLWVLPQKRQVHSLFTKSAWKAASYGFTDISLTNLSVVSWCLHISIASSSFKSFLHKTLFLVQYYLIQQLVNRKLMYH